jgi:hypothetical protein
MGMRNEFYKPVGNHNIQILYWRPLVMDDFHDPHHEHPEDELPEPSKFKKVIVVAGGVFLILLMITYVIASYPVGNILRGQLESTPLTGNKIILENFTIFFEDNTNKELQDIYFGEQSVEFSVCLSGNKEKDNYYVNSLYLPEQTAQFNHVSFQPCNQETLIMLHSHPYKSCLASETDLNTLEKTKKVNPDVLMVVMCEPGRFSVYN